MFKKLLSTAIIICASMCLTAQTTDAKQRVKAEDSITHMAAQLNQYCKIERERIQDIAFQLAKLEMLRIDLVAKCKKDQAKIDNANKRFEGEKRKILQRILPEACYRALPVTYIQKLAAPAS
ncbi:MAG: hypothetical protein RL660_705 [Bacteroidota bacterium]